METKNDPAGQIAQGIGDLHRHWYGHEAGAVNCYIVPDRVVVVVLRETFSNAERALIERNEGEGIQEIRRRFQRTNAQEFCSIVEQATGHEVTTFTSDSDLNHDLSTEIFLLGGVLEDMAAFERDWDKEES